MKRIIWGLALALSAVFLLPSCEKNDIEMRNDWGNRPNRPKSLAGTTWIMPLSLDRGYSVYRFSSDNRYQKEVLDHNAILTKVEEAGRYSFNVYSDQWVVVFHRDNSSRNGSLYINYSEGYMWRESQRYQRQ